MDLAQHAPNLWGALGCSVGYAGALFTTLDVIGSHLELRGTTPDAGLGGRLRSVGKLSGAGITVFSAGSVLALDSNWFALGTLSLFFVIVVVASCLVARSTRGQAGEGAITPHAAEDQVEVPNGGPTKTAVVTPVRQLSRSGPLS